MLCSQSFLSTLEERQKECRLYVDHIGDILKSNIANMGVYLVGEILFVSTLKFSQVLQEYCVNQGYAIKVLQSLRQSNTELASRLQVCRAGRSKSSLLIL